MVRRGFWVRARIRGRGLEGEDLKGRNGEDSGSGGLRLAGRVEDFEDCEGGLSAWVEDDGRQGKAYSLKGRRDRERGTGRRRRGSDWSGTRDPVDNSRRVKICLV